MENNKKTILVLTLIIIVILLGIVLGKMGYMIYNINTQMVNLEREIKELKNESLEIKKEEVTNIQNEQQQTEYNISGYYILDVGDIATGGVPMYEFSEGKVIYTTYSWSEGTYEIVGNKIKITYNSSYDPDGMPEEVVIKEEELTIVNEDKLTGTKQDVNGETYYGEYIKIKTDIQS